MGKYFNHQVKDIIRLKWCKPLIEHVHNTLNLKLLYLGLPGIEAADIKDWLEYIDQVIAFDIGHYDKPYDHEIAKNEIRKLNDFLNSLENKGKLKTFSLYHGYIEDVVIRGKDMRGNPFNLNDVVTLYNLDFCNSLTVPQEVIDLKTGEVFEYYKSHVIRKLLELQRNIAANFASCKFILFLTVHCQFWEDEAERLFQGNESLPFQQYLETLANIPEFERNIRLLRYYIIDLIKTHFQANEFTPEFLPTLFYEGIGKNRLLTFTIIGTRINNAAAKAPFYQNLSDLVNQKFLLANETEVKHLIQANVTEKNSILNSVQAFSNTRSYKNHWSEKR